MKKKERLYVLAAIFLLILLIIKSIYFDNYIPKNKEEELFKEYAEIIAWEQNEKSLDKGRFTTYKVVKITRVEDDGESIIQIYDDNKELEEVKLQGKYKAKIRKYIFGVFPYGEATILSRE